MTADARGDPRLAEAARRLVGHLLAVSGLPVAVRLWDGSRVEPPDGPPAGTVAITGPGVLGAILARPSLDTLFRAYVTGGLEPVEGDLLRSFEAIATRKRARRPRWRSVLAGLPWGTLVPLWRARTRIPAIGHALAEGERPAGSGRATDETLIRFHYDVGNEFYALFLDPAMVYSCAYFRDPEGDLAAAQRDKLELVCRKLRLRPGLRLLDIGCGWGALLIHAARQHGIVGHGVTLSAAQAELARARVAEAGLPVVLQDDPAASGVRLPVDVLLRAAEACRAAAVKLEDPPTPPKIAQLLAARPDLRVFGGLGGLHALGELRRGAVGTMTGFAYPEVLRAVRLAVARGDLRGAAGVFDRYLPLIAFEAQPGIGIAIRKELLRRRGVLVSAATRMGAPPDPLTLQELDEVLDRAGMAPSPDPYDVAP